MHHVWGLPRPHSAPAVPILLFAACEPTPALATQSLTDEAHQVEEDLREAEAKNRLYTLLLERTRREHMAIDQQVRGAG